MNSKLLTGLALIAAVTLSPCSGKALIDLGGGVPFVPYSRAKINSICPSPNLNDDSLAITYEIDVHSGDTPADLATFLNLTIVRPVNSEELLRQNRLSDYREVCLVGEERSGPQEDHILSLWTDKLEYTRRLVFNYHLPMLP